VSAITTAIRNPITKSIKLAFPNSYD
jgi:hypothetical protein